MNLKSLRAPLELKADDSGLVSAVFSTFNVVDKDGDIVLPSAFTHGQEVPMAWAHDWQSPVGRGTILVEQTRALFDGKFFMDTQAGSEAYKTVKAMGTLQEWSWGFRVLDSAFEQRNEEFIRIIKRAEVFEVSPVLVGAGENTQTLSIKAGIKVPLEDEAEAVLAAVASLTERVRSVQQLRAKEGRAISTARRTRMGQIAEQLSAASADLTAILTETEPKSANRDATQVLRLRMDTDRMLARLRAQGIGVPA